MLIRPLLLAAILVSTASCASPNVIGVIEGEPVCGDFTLSGDTTMKGSLKVPVRVSILDGDDVEWERVLLGKREASDEDSKFVVEDDDEKYTVRWAQCSNIFAPRRVEDAQSRTQDRGLNYNCGEAKTYKEHELTIRQGDSKSRVLAWHPPPDPACWRATAEPASSASASASGEPDQPPDAGADAAADASASASASASAAREAASAKPAPKPPVPKPPVPKAPAPKAPAPKAPAPKPPVPKAPVPKAPAPKAPAPSPPPPSGI